MIHHLARAFFVRNALGIANKPASGECERPPSAPAPRPVRARPITPWGTPTRPEQGASAAPAMQAGGLSSRRVRISTDPADARRTVIVGRFAEVCAALDRLVLEQEAAA